MAVQSRPFLRIEVNMSRIESFDREELLRCGRGELFGPGNAQLPVPNMLMMDRVTRIADEGGAWGFDPRYDG